MLLYFFNKKNFRKNDCQMNFIKEKYVITKIRLKLNFL